MLGTVLDVSSTVKRGETHLLYSCTADREQVKGGPHMDGSTVSSLREDDIHSIVAIGGQEGEDTVDDLLSLSYLHDSTLLHQVRQRYFQNIIYTLIGPIVLALNPYDYKLPNYTADNMPKYLEEGDAVVRGKSVNIPHAWTTAHRAYWLLRSGTGNQSVIVSGESGAGKTETAKIVLKYLANVSTQQCTDDERTQAEGVNNKVVLTSPILEAFGNAKTKRNDNSSRFGKFMKVHFSPRAGTMVGAEIEVYLLEKSRIITHAEGERSYHSFYQLLDGADAERRKLLAVTGASQYRSLAEGKAVIISGVDDSEDFRTVERAMDVVGFAKAEQSEIWMIVAGVIHTLSVSIKAKSDDEAMLDPSAAANRETILSAIEKLWGVSAANLEKELLTTTSTVAGETFTKKLRLGQAVDVRDALCKSVYERLFLYLVSRINESVLVDPQKAVADNCWTGLLDIFGFEHFEVNSFEQLCINLANETLQNHYNAIIFTRDMEECHEEGINTESIVFYDNQPCLDLVCGYNFSALTKSAWAAHSKNAAAKAPSVSAKNPSLFSLIDEESRLGKGSDISFLEKAVNRYGQHPNFEKPPTEKSTFIIKHYAGDVKYSVDGFREKNLDTMKESLKALLRGSSLALMSQHLFPPEEKETRGQISVSTLYKQQLVMLMTELNSTHPHWIRCVKPHHAKKPRMFCGTEVMTQMRSAGVLETVRIRKMSFSMRFLFTDFVNHFRLLFTKEAWISRSSDKQACVDLLKKCKVDHHSEAQVGKTKVFLKTEAYYTVSRKHHALKNRLVEVLQAHLLRYRAAQQVRVRQYTVYIRWITAAMYYRPATVELRRHELREKEKYLIQNFRHILQLQSKEHNERGELLNDEDNQRLSIHRRRAEAEMQNLELSERDSRRHLFESAFLAPLQKLGELEALQRSQLNDRVLIEEEYLAAHSTVSVAHSNLVADLASLRRQHLLRQLSSIQVEENAGRNGVVILEDFLFVMIVRSQRLHLAEELQRQQHGDDEAAAWRRFREDESIAYAGLEERWHFRKAQRDKHDVLQLRREQHETRLALYRKEEGELLNIMALLEIDFSEAARKEAQRAIRFEKRQRDAERQRKLEAERAEQQRLALQREQAKKIWMEAKAQQAQEEQRRRAEDTRALVAVRSAAESADYVHGFTGSKPGLGRLAMMRGAFSRFRSAGGTVPPSSERSISPDPSRALTPARLQPQEDMTTVRSKASSRQALSQLERVRKTASSEMKHFSAKTEILRKKQRFESMSPTEKHEYRKQLAIVEQYQLSPYNAASPDRGQGSPNRTSASRSPNRFSARSPSKAVQAVRHGSIDPFKPDWRPPDAHHVYLPNGKIVPLDPQAQADEEDVDDVLLLSEEEL